MGVEEEVLVLQQILRQVEAVELLKGPVHQLQTPTQTQLQQPLLALSTLIYQLLGP